MNAKPTFRFLISHPAHFISLGCGSGLSPIMPGTVGTLFGWGVFHLLTECAPTYFTQTLWMFLAGAGFVLGCKTCTQTGQALGNPDDGAMVIDEIIAMWLVLLVFMPASIIEETVLFILFRVFDMTKPPPIKQIDAKVKGGFGVMIDDIIAALFTIIGFCILKFIASCMGY